MNRHNIYHNLTTVHPWVMNFNGYSKRGMGICIFLIFPGFNNTHCTCEREVILMVSCSKFPMHNTVCLSYLHRVMTSLTRYARLSLNFCSIPFCFLLFVSVFVGGSKAFWVPLNICEIHLGPSNR